MLADNVLDDKLGCAEQLSTLLATVLVRLLLLEIRRHQTPSLVLDVAATELDHIGILVDDASDLEVQVLDPTLVAGLGRICVPFAWGLTGSTLLGLAAVCRSRVSFLLLGFLLLTITSTVLRSSRLRRTEVTNTLALQLLGECSWNNAVVAGVEAVAKVREVLVESDLRLRYQQDSTGRY